ncbi:MAG: undecaprenyl-diphosphatase UppP [Parcubacteria group bacterium]|jgi:undecaprenyl-diphosphatase
MTIFQSIFLGIIQGAGEFLPISSSAHLVLAPWLFSFSDPGLSFDVALHFGTLLAVILYFFRDWVEIIKLALSNFQSISDKSISNNDKKNSYSKNILYFLILATIPGVLAGYFLESYAESTFRSPILIAFTLSAVGLILYLVDKYHQHRKKISQMSWLDSLAVGLSQAIAIVPGVSRSGATITAGLAMGLSRESAARFSFLLSTPIIFGAAVFKLPHFLKSGFDIYLLVGMLAAAVSGYAAIKYLLKFVEKTSYAIFFWYRLALAAVILAVYFARG